MSYIDAIVHFCEQNSIDVESVPKLITKPLKEKIKYEAMELPNFLRGPPVQNYLFDSIFV